MPHNTGHTSNFLNFSAMPHKGPAGYYKAYDSCLFEDRLSEKDFEEGKRFIQQLINDSYPEDPFIVSLRNYLTSPTTGDALNLLRKNLATSLNDRLISSENEMITAAQLDNPNDENAHIKESPTLRTMMDIIDAKRYLTPKNLSLNLIPEPFPATTISAQSAETEARVASRDLAPPL